MTYLEELAKKKEAAIRKAAEKKATQEVGKAVTVIAWAAVVVLGAYIILR